jgi:hypothetical protein
MLHHVLYYVGVAETSILLYVLLLAALAVALVPRVGMQRNKRIIVVASAAIGTVGAFIVDDQYDSYRRAVNNYYDARYYSSYGATLDEPLTKPELPLFATILSGVVLVACLVTWVFLVKSLRSRQPGVRFLSFLGGYTVALASLSVFAYMVDLQVTPSFAAYGSKFDNALLDVFVYARDFAFIMACLFIITGIVVIWRAYGRRQFQKGVEFGRNNPEPLDDGETTVTPDQSVQVADLPKSPWATQGAQS